jgi:hypothetical protein
VQAAAAAVSNTSSPAGSEKEQDGL